MARRVSAYHEAARMVAFRETHSDGGAARWLGDAARGAAALELSPSAFRVWRLSRGLSRPRDGRKLPSAEIGRRRRIVRRAPSLREAARRIGISEAGLQLFLRTYGASRRRASPEADWAGHPVPEGEARRLAAYRVTGSDRDAAAQLGMRAGTFSAWRRSRGLPARGARKRPG